jgi:hypothetical protein
MTHTEGFSGVLVSGRELRGDGQFEKPRRTLIADGYEMGLIPNGTGLTASLTD